MSRLQEFIEFKNGKKRPLDCGIFPIYGGNGILAYADAFNAENCIIIGRVGACGSVFISEDKCWVSDNAMIAVPKDNADLHYMYYLLSSLNLNARHIGSVQPLITQDILNRIEVNIPNKAEQTRIAGMLISFDEKIKLNNLINQNLEQLAQSLFKSWFVYFEPFGGHKPNDWNTIALSDIAEFSGGYSYKSDELTESKIAMATIKNFDRNGGFKLDGYKEVCPSGKLKANQHAELFDIFVAHTDLTQNAEVVGNAELIMSKCDYRDLIYSMDLVKVKSKITGISNFLLASILRDDRFKSHCLGYVNGTTVLHLSKRALPDYTFEFPSDISVLNPLDESLSSIYRMISRNIEESRHLSDLRDMLLPKLMSGELDVSELEI